MAADVERRDGADAAGPEQESVFGILAAHARRASDAELALLAWVGAAGAVTVLIVRPRWWPLALAFACAASLGAWGIAEREASERERAGTLTVTGRRALRVARLVAATVGGIAGLGALLALLGLALGTWIS